MSDLISQPENGLLSGAYPHGTLDQYNIAELDQISKVQSAGQMIDEVQHSFQCEVIRLKLLLDGQDQADGITPGNGRPPSRFWDGARAGHFGDKLQEIADSGQRGTVQRWLTANEAASTLLKSSVSRDTQLLPIEVARERGMGQTALCIYQRLFPEARDMATHYFTVTGELRSDMLQEFEQVIREFPDRTDEVLQAITNRTLTVPSQFKRQKEEWRQEIAIQRALAEERERQDKLAVAENKEEELENEAATDADTPKPAKVEDVTRRIAPTAAWFKSDSGLIKTKEVVGDLPAPLADAVNGLVDLKKELIAQVEHMAEMHHYAEFWAGYDRHAMSASASQRVWGKSGRLGRMKKLRGLLIEIQQRLDVYIENSSPPLNIEYPDD